MIGGGFGMAPVTASLAGAFGLGSTDLALSSLPWRPAQC